MYVNEDGKMHFYIFCLFRSSQNFREEISKPIIQLMKLGMRSLKICHSMGLYYEKKKRNFLSHSVFLCITSLTILLRLLYQRIFKFQKSLSNQRK